MSQKKNYGNQDKDKIFNSQFIPLLGSLYCSAYHLTYDEDESKDLVQETYYKAYKFIDSFQNGTNAKAWLSRILKNSFINNYRKRRNEPSKVDYQQVESIYNSGNAGESVTSDLGTGALKDMIGDELSIALNSLDANYRSIIILYVVKGFKYVEIAKIQDIPIGTVRSRLHRARKLLKKMLGNYGHKMGYLN